MNTPRDKYNIPSEKGSYILFIEINKGLQIQVGKLGKYYLPRGNYLYVGSALGPGGLKARIRRHFSKNKNIKYVTLAGSLSRTFQRPVEIRLNEH